MAVQSIYEKALIDNLVTTEDGEYSSILGWLEQNISKNKEFTVDVGYIKKILGPEFNKKKDDVISISLRNILEKYNIGVRRTTQGNVRRLILNFINV